MSADKVMELRQKVRDGAAAAADGPAAESRLVPVRLMIDEVRNPPHEVFALGRTLPFEKVTVVFGPTGAGKSAVLAQVVFGFAAGAEQLWGLPIFPGGGPVLVYTAEDTLDDWKRKAGAILHAGDVDVARALERVFIVDKTEGVTRFSELVTVRTGDSQESVARRDARPTEEQRLVADAARSIGARLIVFETASRFVEEEDNAAFSALQSDLGRIARETGAAVALSHHATKAATKENDSAIESARGGGALIANARNALSLFPLDPQHAGPYQDRFPLEDLFVLEHGKATSSTRRQEPLVLVRCDTPHGAVFRLPDEAATSPDLERRLASRLEAERHRDREALGRLFDVVAAALPTRPAMSPSWLRENAARDLGLSKHRVEPLVQHAIKVGVLRVHRRTERGITVVLGLDPRLPVDTSRANPGASEETAP